MNIITYGFCFAPNATMSNIVSCLPQCVKNKPNPISYISANICLDHGKIPLCRMQHIKTAFQHKTSGAIVKLFVLRRDIFGEALYLTMHCYASAKPFSSHPH